MGMFERIFGKREQPAGLKNAQIFRMMEGYTPAWTTWQGSIYESELIRASLDAWGRHAGKLKPNLKGAAMKDLQNRLKVRPNAFLQWSQFLYQAATILGVRDNEFIVKTRAEDGTPTGIISIVPDRWELVEYEGEPWIRFIMPNMGVMPALMSSTDLSFCGTSEKLGRRRWPFVSKYARNISRSSFRPNFFMRVPSLCWRVDIPKRGAPE